KTIEDIGKEADKWDDEEPLSADNEFTVSYGVSDADRASMLAVIGSVSKRKLARAAKVSTRSIPGDKPGMKDFSDADLRRLFEVASGLAEEARKPRESDKELLDWLTKRIAQRGLTVLAKELPWDASNLAKVAAGKRGLPKELRKKLSELTIKN